MSAPQGRESVKEGVLDALKLPADARIDKRVPKKLLLDQKGTAATDKRLIQEGIEELVWIAALKPSILGIPAWRDDVREYLEIAVLSVALRPQAKVPRLIELIHRAIPYPVLLVVVQGDAITVSLAHKRLSQGSLSQGRPAQGDGGQLVVEAIESTRPFRLLSLSALESAFLESLAISAQPSRDLFALYQGWSDRVNALAAAHISGQFTVAETPEQANLRRAALLEHLRLQKEITGLRVQARNAHQMNQRVNLNLEIRRLEALLAEGMTRL